MTRTKIGLLAVILVFTALGLFSVYHAYAGPAPIMLAQAVQDNEPFVYQALDNPNDYNWQGTWDPRSDPDWNRTYNRDRDKGASSRAAAPCRD